MHKIVSKTDFNIALLLIYSQLFREAQGSDVHVFNYGIIKSLPGKADVEEEEKGVETSDVKLSLRIKIREEPFEVVSKLQLSHNYFFLSFCKFDKTFDWI